MSFRTRLNLFFVLLVVAPLFAVGVVLLRTIDGAAQGKVESALASQGRAVARVSDIYRDQAAALNGRIARDRELAAALESGSFARVEKRAGQLLSPNTDARRMRITIARTGKVVDVGSPSAVLPQRNDLVGSGSARERLGTIETSVIGPKSLASRLEGLTGRMIQVRSGRTGRVIAGATDGPSELPPQDRVKTVDGGDWTAVMLREAGFGGPQDGVVIFNRGDDSRASTGERIALIGTLVLFLVLAGIGALAVSRSLQRQVGILLEGSKRLGEGDFQHEIPRGNGDDEFALLADGFNAMSRQLRRRLDELEDERARLRSAIRRIGETFAANLDREGLLEIVARAAADGVRADAARARVVVDGREEVAETGGTTRFDALLRRAADRAGEGREVLLSDGSQHALAVVMHAADLVGTVVVARDDVPFTKADAEMVGYLSGQAAVSLENVGRHEEAEREAHTDPLTGLANRRRFDDLLASAVDAAEREGRPLSLLALDLDHFKSVNDQYGHGVGDEVLKATAQALREAVRGGDVAARLGGEEFAVVLPHADVEGARILAERLRIAVGGLVVPAGDGREVRFTTSVGTATVSGPTIDVPRLVASADEALYAAKRGGRNRTVSADDSAQPG
ncbi:GGDEF domain-containing protein [Patulibacter minatonensis]|uniref:GGDEF domain-containing protein n=1 Tax=Patulibacter minatonensis TaxID=298163 RepID=UPI0004B514E1|nr:GGDEF domain-containing protein [Patulibacter minatonensis]